ncbi:MAG: hypothetical protein ACKO8Z_17715, partial [Prosthecobacter sp.]
MISLQKLFGKTDVFYDLLERSAKEAQNSVHLLKDLLSKPAGSQSLDSLSEARRKDKAITQEIDEALCKT